MVRKEQTEDPPSSAAPERAKQAQSSRPRLQAIEKIVLYARLATIILCRPTVVQLYYKSKKGQGSVKIVQSEALS